MSKIKQIFFTQLFEENDRLEIMNYMNKVKHANGSVNTFTQGLYKSIEILHLLGLVLTIC